MEGFLLTQSVRLEVTRPTQTVKPASGAPRSNASEHDSVEPPPQTRLARESFSRATRLTRIKNDLRVAFGEYVQCKAPYVQSNSMESRSHLPWGNGQRATGKAPRKFSFWQRKLVTRDQWTSLSCPESVIGHMNALCAAGKRSAVARDPIVSRETEPARSLRPRPTTQNTTPYPRSRKGRECTLTGPRPSGSPTKLNNVGNNTGRLCEQKHCTASFNFVVYKYHEIVHPPVQSTCHFWG